jgi:hypothetical protein
LQNDFEETVQQHSIKERQKKMFHWFECLEMYWLKDSSSNATKDNHIVLPECETPQTLQEYLTLADKCLKKFLELERGGENEGKLYFRNAACHCVLHFL